MTVEQVLRVDNFQEQDARSFERKNLAWFLPTVDGIPTQKLEIV